MDEFGVDDFFANIGTKEQDASQKTAEFLEGIDHST
jgi:hypothetical protein